MGGPALAAAATLVVLTAQGALAAQFAISGMPFTVTADSLEGRGFGQFGGLDNMPEGSPNAGDTGGQVLVIVTAIREAELTNLCQSVELGGTFLHITAGAKGTPVKASGLTTDSTEISGKVADFDNIEIGGDASTFEKPPVKGPLGVFGQQADTVRIKDLRQTNYATTAVRFTLPDLKMRFSSKGC
ncbi:Cholesterol esterase [Streptomyces venezuelae]|nr:Cholesterol esterase [Streptomyces venezuelae]